MKKGDVLFFRFGPSPVYTDQELKSFKDIVVRIGASPPIVYDAYQDEKQTPIIYIKIMKLAQDAAELRIGFGIEGAVGVFTLIKKDTWAITEHDVYEI